MDLEAFIGTAVGPYHTEVTASRLRAFADAIGASDLDGLPTFLTICREGEIELVAQLGIELSRVLHGEQEYTLMIQPQPGDALRYTTRVEQALGKKNGMTFLVFETEVQAERQGAWIRIGTSLTTLVVRA